MTPVDDDLAIRAALSDLTGGQPPAPPGRFQSVRQRAIRHRQRRLVGGLMAAVAAAGLGLGLLQLPALQPQPSAVRPVPAWALPWPDHRNGSVPQSVLDRAVLAWRYGYPNLPPDGGSGKVPAAGTPAKQVARMANAFHVVWYVGQTIDQGQNVVVMFEVAGRAGHALVVGQATSAEVMHNQPAWSGATSPWVLTSVPAPNPDRPPAAIGEYVPGQPASSPGQNPDNWMVVLMQPYVRRLTWLAATMSGDGMHSAATSDGLVVADTGQVTAPVRLTGMTTDHGNLLGQPVTVGVPGDHSNSGLTRGTGPGTPQLAAPPAFSEPAAFNMSAGLSGQGDGAMQISTFKTGPSRYVVLGVCYGPQPLKIHVDGHPLGSMPCNSQQQQLAVPRSVLHGQDVTLIIFTSNLTSWRTEVGTLP